MKTRLIPLMGIIPARAGFTLRTRSTGCATTDHPRSRGVYLLPVSRSNSRGGSSPLARGLQGGRPRPPPPHRIIPARAGFTRRASTPSSAASDHPRSRGVYSATKGGFGVVTGSSPLARGLRALSSRSRSALGIIPARAGFTVTDGEIVMWLWDHPRSRGVYALTPGNTRERTGSSPLARGLLDPGRVQAALPRIIPARAGFTPPTGRGRP